MEDNVITLEELEEDPVEKALAADACERERIFGECQQAISAASASNDPTKLEKQLKFTIHYMQTQNKRYAEIQAKKLEALARTKKKCRVDFRKKQEELEANYDELMKDTKAQLESEKQLRRSEVKALRKQLKQEKEQNELLQRQIRGSAARSQRELQLKKREVNESKKKSRAQRSNLQSKVAELKLMQENQQIVLDQNQSFREQIDTLVKNQEAVLREKESALQMRDDALKIASQDQGLYDEAVININNIARINQTLIEDNFAVYKQLISRDLEVERLNDCLIDLEDKLRDQASSMMLEMQSQFEQSMEQEKAVVDSISERWRKTMDDVFLRHGEEISELTAEHKERVHELKSQINRSMQSEIFQQEMLKNYERIVAQMNAEIGKLAEESDAHVNTKHDLKAHLERAKIQRDNLEEKITHITAENEMAEKKLCLMKSELSNLRQNVARDEIALQKGQMILDSKDDEIESLKDIIESKEESHHVTLEAKELEFHNMRTAKDLKIQNLETARELDAENLRRTCQEEIQVMKAAVGADKNAMELTMEQLNEECEQKLRTVKAEYDKNLQKVKANAAELQKDLEVRQSDWENQREELLSEEELLLKEEHEKHESEIQDIQHQYEHELEEQQKEVIEKERQIERLEADLNNAKRRITELAGYEDIAQTYKAKLDIMKKEGEMLNQERRREDEAQILDLQTIITHLTTVKDDLSQQLELSMAEIKKLEKEKSKVEKEKEKMHEKAIRNMGQVQAIAQEILLTKKELLLRETKAKEMIERHNEKEEELKIQIEKREKANLKLQDELDDTKSTLDYLTNATHVYSPRKARYTEKAVDQLRDKFDTVRNEKKDLNKNLNNAKDKIWTLTDKLSLTNEILAMQREQLDINAENNVRLKDRCQMLQIRTSSKGNDSFDRIRELFSTQSRYKFLQLS